MNIRELQILLKTEIPALSIDGIAGIKTYDAYASASAALRERIGEKFRYGTKETILRSSWWDSAEVDAMIALVSSEEGVPASYLALIAKVEPRKKVINGVTFYDAASTNGSYFGLGQMGRPAWVDAVSLNRRLPSFDDGWRDPIINLRATATFYKVNLAYIKRKYNYRGTMSDELAYAMHNQGHTVYDVFIRKGPLKFPAQSTHALSVMKQARSEFKTSLQVA